MVLANLTLLANGTLIEQFSHAFEAVGATWVLWVLIGLSVISVAIMIERAIYFSTHSIGNVDALIQQLSTGDLAGAVKAVEGRSGLEAEVVREGVKAVANGAESVDQKVDAIVLREKMRYERFLGFLGTVGNNAPFIGLFGTVLGIVGAFAALAKNAKAGTMTSGGSNIMEGISEALVATAVGLLVALPAVALYNVFTRWMKTIITRGEALSHALQAHLTALPAEAADAPAPVALPRAAGK